MRQKVIDYLIEEPRKTTIEELKQIFALSTSQEFIDLVKTVNQLVEEAILIENTKHEVAHIKYTNFVKGSLDLKAKGFGFLIPDDPSLNDVFIPAQHVGDAMNKDHCLVHLLKNKRGFRAEGEIKRVLERKYAYIIGTLEYKNGMGLIKSDDKTITTEIVVKRENQLHAKQYDKVRAKIVNYSFKGKIECVITDVLGNINDAGVDVLSKILQYNVDPIFSDEVLADAAQYMSISQADLAGRRDLRDEMIITIDGDDAKDFDDAVIVKQLPNGNYHLGVHIADVSYYVKKDSPLDKEAYHRGTSVYLPGQVIPMLPVSLSNHLCSLVPHEDRLTISCDMEINHKGKIVKYDIYPSVINSKQRMTYNKVNDIFMGDVALNEQYVDYIGMFYDMRNLAKILKKERDAHGSINFETDESYITLDENGKAVAITLRERGVSQNIIEEFMLKANQVVAENMFWLDLPFIYRIHDKPTAEKLNRLIRMSSALGHPVKGKTEVSHYELQKLLENIKNTPAEKGINLMMLRSMQKAIYSENNIGHYGLSFTYYTHFTSPIRRYPDLIVHRLLREYLFTENKSTQVIEYYADKMPDIARQTSATERNAVMLERDVVDMKKAEYISQFIGDEFDGIISSVTGFGIYVTLENTVEGLVHVTELKDDYYHFDQDLLMMIGERKKKQYRVGTQVRVKVLGTNISEGDVDFTIVRS